MKPPSKLIQLLTKAVKGADEAAAGASPALRATKSLSDIDFNADMSTADISWVLANVGASQLTEHQKELMYWASSVNNNLSDEVDKFLYGTTTMASETPKASAVDVPEAPMVDFGKFGSDMSEIQVNNVLFAMDPLELTKQEIDDLHASAANLGESMLNKVKKWSVEGPDIGEPVDVAPYMIGPLKDRPADAPLTLTPEEAAKRVNELLRSGRADEVTEQLYGMADRETLRAGYDLPMDAQSRFDRRMQHWPGTGYHFTQAEKDFSVPNFGVNAHGADAGFHFGTMESARDRAFATTPTWNDAPRYSYLPTQAAMYDRALEDLAAGRKATYTVDGKVFDVPNAEVLDQLAGVFNKVKYADNSRVMQLAYDPSQYAQITSDTGSWTPASIAQHMGEYATQIQGAPNIENALRQLAQEQAQRRVYLKSVPEIAEAYGVNKDGWALEGLPEKPVPKMSGVEVDEMRALFDGYGIKGLSYPNRVEGYKGENSYVALQPGIVRSVNANFDPRLKHLGNMMAAGVPLVYGIARQPEE